MRSFAEERKEGTYVLLATRPLTNLQIISAKYLACLVLVLFALLPTLIYCYSIAQLGLPKGNLDTGAIIGSYIGLFLLGVPLPLSVYSLLLSLKIKSSLLRFLFSCAFSLIVVLIQSVRFRPFGASKASWPIWELQNIISP